MRSIKLPGCEITDGCKMWYAFWRLNAGPLEEQHVFYSRANFLTPRK